MKEGSDIGICNPGVTGEVGGVRKGWTLFPCAFKPSNYVATTCITSSRLSEREGHKAACVGFKERQLL